MNLEILKEKFDIFILDGEFTKIGLNNSTQLIKLLNYLKDDAEFDFDRLNTIIGVDLKDKIELIYDLFSTNAKASLRISLYTSNFSAPSVVSVFKSAYFDECEIYDMLGVKFDNNSKLKRLLMPKDWIGYPLRKDYELNDERLAWNK